MTRNDHLNFAKVNTEFTNGNVYHADGYLFGVYVEATFAPKDRGIGGFLTGNPLAGFCLDVGPFGFQLNAWNLLHSRAAEKRALARKANP